MTNPQARQGSPYELHISRSFDAPIEVLFKAWTDPRAMEQWAGPKNFTVVGDRLELRVGGTHRACLIAPAGEKHWVSGTYVEIEPPRRLVFTHAWEQPDGGRSPETVVTIEFRADGGKTTMLFRQAFFETEASRDGHEGGWTEGFERLAVYVKAAIVETREPC